MRPGRITIHRRGGPRFDLLRGYRILIDGEAVGKLRLGGSLTVEHPPGLAKIEARIDWCSAAPLTVLIEAAETTVVEVMNSRGFTGALVANDVLEPDRYLKLTLVSGKVPATGPWG